MRTSADFPWNVFDVPAGNVPSMLTFPSTVTRSHEGAERMTASELAPPSRWAPELATAARRAPARLEAASAGVGLALASTATLPAVHRQLVVDDEGDQ